jgi:hydrophobic/amphiphilic exporter-1 (mainly G- bacteria), HAE1 family
MDALQTFIRRPIFTTMLMLTLVVFGAFAFPRIGVDQFPEVEFPVVTITTVLPGADPETMERDVSEVLEEPLSTLSGLDSLRSVNVESVSQIIVTFDLDKPVDIAAQEVRDKVSSRLARLPQEVTAPVVEKFDIGAAPIMTLALSGPLPVQELTQLAEDVVKEELQRQGGVGSVDVIGGRKREIRVVVDPARLRAMGLAVTDVSLALRQQNLDAPAGRTQEPGRERVVRLEAEARSVDELRSLVIASPGGAPVRLRDVAELVDGPQEARSAAQFNGQTAVAFSVQKQSGANTVQVAERVRKALVPLQERLPAGTRLEVVQDNSTFIRSSIAAVQEDLIIGAALAVLIVLFFLRNGRSTLISAVALPTSIIGTFAVMRYLDFTFNIITMLALTLSIGLLIDDAIVVIENIVRYMEEGKSPRQAAYEATKQIAIAVLAVTLAVVAVFVPVAFMEGIIGRFFYQFGVTVAVAVIISYLVSMTLTPVMASRVLKEGHGEPGALSRAIERGLTSMEQAYARVVSALLRNRAKTMVVASAVLFLTLGLLPLLKFTFIPDQDRSGFRLAVELPVGTPLERTERELQALAEQLSAVQGVAGVYVGAGGGPQQEVNKGNLTVNLVPLQQRGYTQQQLQVWVRSSLVRPADMLLSVQDAGGPGGGRNEPIQLNLRGNDWEALQATAAKVTAAMRERGGFVDIDTTYRGGKPQIEVRVDRERAASLGVPAALVANALRSFLGGDKVASYREGGETYDVKLALPDAVRADAEAIAALTVRSATGQLVELRNVTHLEPGEGPSQIDRQARQRQITVLANLSGLSLGDGVAFLESYTKKELPPGVSVEFDGAAKRLGESVAAFGRALLLGILLVYMILAAQFESLLDPLAIMMSLPFAVIGAFGSLLLAGQEMSMFALIGMIMLMGLVTKNGILLVEFANQLREEGKATMEALIEAGRVRLRPILMTTVAMIAGMVPVALARGDGAETRVPMAIVIIGGLITSTLLTLGVVPVVYSILDGLRSRFIHEPAHGAKVVPLPSTPSSPERVPPAGVA